MKATTSTIAVAISTILIGATPFAAQAQSVTTSTTTAPGTVQKSETVKMTATVVGIDLTTRDLLLIDSKGKMHKVSVSNEARNLDQVKVGDKVNAEYTEAISIQLKNRATGTAPATGQETMVRSPKGDKPAGAVGRTVTAYATIVAVNETKKFVTLKGPLGNQYDVEVLDPAQLAAAKKGEQVEITYSEAFAVAVTPAPGPK